MKKALFLLFIITGYSIFSQNLTVIQFDFTRKTESTPVKSNQFLVLNNKEAFYITPYHKVFQDYSDLVNDKEYSHSTRYMNSLQIEDKGFKGLAYIPNNPNLMLYIDPAPTIIWKILSEKKNILNFNCQAAIGNFRGRVYKVWFTPEIPFSNGPWKLKGLPGMILEAEDNQNEYSYIATKVVINSYLKVPEKLINYYNINEGKEIEYIDFISKTNDALLLFRQKMMANLPKNVVLANPPPIRSLEPEREFEWDTKKP
ncbi:GLPGLI family protein [Chryseobacterium gotjawalense]|uniref:GLPGLI family protein n=1 Tax=Chryseobacterium gotjawalense TaxID=3042315 RepID=A0ABY8RE03_9FLAO|nr:GLPGLI family protein [Chryseobacterium sp. wdc7]WHF52205.1 GLPGLI family protein [Chryseobacterium sp. wdc7]